MRAKVILSAFVMPSNRRKLYRVLSNLRMNFRRLYEDIGKSLNHVFEGSAQCFNFVTLGIEIDGGSGKRLLPYLA